MMSILWDGMIFCTFIKCGPPNRAKQRTQLQPLLTDSIQRLHLATDRQSESVTHIHTHTHTHAHTHTHTHTLTHTHTHTHTHSHTHTHTHTHTLTHAHTHTHTHTRTHTHTHTHTHTTCVHACVHTPLIVNSTIYGHRMIKPLQKTPLVWGPVNILFTKDRSS